MKVAIATDHNGSELKREIIRFLANRDIETMDLSTSNSPVDDYPDYAFTLGKAVANKEADLGILLCGTGIGMSIAANKVKGIRCAHVTSTNDAFLAREHNNANVIALGSKYPLNELLKIVDIFVHTEFKKEDRHLRRINKIYSYENGEYNG